MYVQITEPCILFPYHSRGGCSITWCSFQRMFSILPPLTRHNWTAIKFNRSYWLYVHLNCVENLNLAAICRREISCSVLVKKTTIFFIHLVLDFVLTYRIISGVGQRSITEWWSNIRKDIFQAKDIDQSNWLKGHVQYSRHGRVVQPFCAILHLIGKKRPSQRSVYRIFCCYKI